MDILRRISGSSTSSMDDTPLRRRLSLGPLRRKSSKESSKALKKALKDSIREYNAAGQVATSAPHSPLVVSQTSSELDSPDIQEEEEPQTPSLRQMKSQTSRPYSTSSDSVSGVSDEGEIPLGVAFTALRPRRESQPPRPAQLAPPKLTGRRRISENIDLINAMPAPPAYPQTPLGSGTHTERGPGEGMVAYKIRSRPYQAPAKLQLQTIERMAPATAISPDTADLGSESGSFSTSDLEVRASTVSSITSNSSAPASPQSRTITPYLPDDESCSYDLLPPDNGAATDINGYNTPPTTDVEELSRRLYSKDHLRAITSDPQLLHGFSRFLEHHRPSASMDLLVYYLNAQKAIKAVDYANALAESLGPSPAPSRSWTHTDHEGVTPVSRAVERKAADAFKVLTEQELPRYVAWVYTEIVSYSIQRKITGKDAGYLEGTSHELAEVFCLTDPRRADNPIIFVSEEFHKATQYPPSYVTGRNCRFLQGPKTTHHSTVRLREAIRQGHETTECFLNYKRDGTPFINLCMVAPLLDAKGQVRYFIGAQVDVTALTRDAIGLEGFRRLTSGQRKQSEALGDDLDLDLDSVRPRHVEFKQLCELFSAEEIENVREAGGQLHKDHEIPASPREGELEFESQDDGSSSIGRTSILPPSELDRGGDVQVLLKPKPDIWSSSLQGIYRNYILVRPYPSLRILFASPSMRTPGILQSPLMAKIGGPAHTRETLAASLSTARSITTKVRWLSKQEEQNPKKTELAGRERWLHCTPLLDSHGTVGTWVIILVDDETSTDVFTPEYDISDLSLGVGMNVRASPASGLMPATVTTTAATTTTHRLSDDWSGLAPVGARWRRREAPTIQNPEDWRDRDGHCDLVFDS
ncbi:hypothetical protein DRE_04188 [Drechslerella stenobrocha 248]|uniref:PAC domain-containing protein n=1 Tax=Drechslerella stenobrocha 248 TaxID=1043628 RepID=W7IBN6_9PEZI|nr:hypothetical protein DRE_04188 [Drechslerella stenobrocha 248]